MYPFYASFFVCLFLSMHAAAKAPEVIIDQFCSSCHGDSGQAGNLLTSEYQHVNTVEAMMDLIKNGRTDLGMPAFNDVLSQTELKQLSHYLFNHASSEKDVSNKAALLLNPRQIGLVKSAQGHVFIVEKIVEREGVFWSVDFFPNGDVLIAQRNGTLWRESDGELTQITGIPAVLAKGQGGLLDAKFHPDYKQNGWVYLSYSEDKGVKRFGRTASMTGVVRGQIRDNKWVNQQVIYSADNDLHIAARQHYGSRFVFKNGYVYFSIGDRGQKDQAQDLSRANGKIMRLHDDGRTPKDNPFIGTQGALPHIWSYGHRNPQGMAINPNTGDVWSAEHGPKGGDEINLIEKAHNYGWPVITYGVNYSGTKITDKTHMDGMEQPKHYWTPSIAVGDIDFVDSEMFYKWQGALLVASLKSQELRLVRVKGTEVISDDVVLSGVARIREAQIAPDGSIYLAANSRKTGKAQILRLVVVEDDK